MPPVIITTVFDRSRARIWAAFRSPRRTICADAGIAVASTQMASRTLISPHHVDDDVDREFGVVLAQEALVSPIVVPLAAVVLAAVQHREPSATVNPLQVLVHDVVAP